MGKKLGTKRKIRRQKRKSSFLDVAEMIKGKSRTYSSEDIDAVVYTGK